MGWRIELVEKQKWMKLTNGCFVCHIAELSRYQKGDTPVSKKLKKKKRLTQRLGKRTSTTALKDSIMPRSAQLQWQLAHWMSAAYLYISVVSKWRVAGGLLGAADTCERVFASVAAELAKEKKKKNKKNEKCHCVGLGHLLHVRYIIIHSHRDDRSGPRDRRWLYIHCWPLITYSSIYMCTY